MDAAQGDISPTEHVKVPKRVRFPNFQLTETKDYDIKYTKKMDDRSIELVKVEMTARR